MSWWQRLRMLHRPEGWATDDAWLQQEILRVLDQHVEQFDTHVSDERLCMRRPSIAEAVGITEDHAMNLLFLLTSRKLVFPTSYEDGIEVYTLDAPGKVAMIERTLLIESGKAQFEFLRNGMALLISLVALALSIAAFVRTL